MHIAYNYINYIDMILVRLYCRAYVALYIYIYITLYAFLMQLKRA